jgi:hypothetical protein
MRRSLALATALALLTAASLSTSALAGNDRPISGHFTVSVVPVEQRCGPNALTIGFEGAGIASHLGRMTGHGSNCTSFSLATEAVGIWEGVATFVAADGSSFTVRYEGVQTAPVAGVAATVITNEIISGTGRFENAEGSWAQSGEIDFTTGVFHGSFAGSIEY